MDFDEARGNQVVAATIVDELYRCGIRLATISPGSRSTPLALAFLAHEGIACQVILDERSAGYFALGAAKASGVPAAVVTTSGTAAVELSAAVTEAAYSQVPLLVLSADRPLELYHTGAPQTIDQTSLYGGALLQRRLIDAGSPSSWSRLRATVARAVLVASGLNGASGPVQLNVSFREPLIDPEVTSIVPLRGREDSQAWYRKVDLADLWEVRDFALELLSAARGLIVVGESIQHEAVFAISELLGWPTMVDPRSGLARRSRYALSYQDAFLRLPEILDGLTPEVVLYFGKPQASRVLSEFLARVADPALKDAARIYRGGDGAADPEGLATGLVVGPLERLVAALTEAELEGALGVDEDFVSRYLRLDHLCDSEVRSAEREGSLGVEIQSLRSVVGALTSKDLLYASASMPMRDLEFFSGLHHDYPRVLENRGANGIDGVIASFAGAALMHQGVLDGGIAVLVIGDLAFLYDASFLRELVKIDRAVLVLVLDNNGGGIFSFLPQKGSVSSHLFEEAFGTPHEMDIADVVAAYSIPCQRDAKAAEIPNAIAALRHSRQLRVMVISSGRDENLDAHRQINARIAAAIRFAGQA